MFKVFVNFKTYPQGSGAKAVLLAKVCENISKKTKVEIIPIVQAADVYLVKQTVSLSVWVQHLDWQESGAFTGWQNQETATEAGASGTLLNHSEHQISPGTVKQTISRIRNFEVMVCCKTLGQMERLVKIKPSFLGYEISELIGGKISITQSNPKSISKAVEICGKIPLIVGAGINKAEDLQKARQLGAGGVLISSAVVLAKDPQEKLLELVSLLGEDKK